ncbi:MAG TPA: flagellar basal body L-ring protein FlgH, partial [candidate division Zixibacteria bacterium]|nr:flagellar basal body L-ring protein FlgH [candidate division Zixibacteria bacterium]
GDGRGHCPSRRLAGESQGGIMQSEDQSLPYPVPGILKRILIPLLFVIGWAVGLSANPLTPMQNASLFTDIKAHKVGDLLTVRIVESATARNAVTTNTKKSSDFELDAGPGTGELDFIGLFGLNSSHSSKTDNQGQTSRAGQLQAQMTVQVVGVRENGDLVIQGSRVIGINNDKEQLTLTGIVRPNDITPENAILSYQIAEAQITYRGKGVANAAGKPGVISRILNWIF